MNKRILSFIVSLTLICTSLLGFGGATLAASVSNGDSDYANAADVLQTICPGIIPEGDGSYTRAEFVSAVIALLNMPTNPKAATPFSDIPEGAAYAPAVAAALDLGLVSGVDLFYPDSPVTYVQALKIVMTAIGYGKIAEVNGGYPTGYAIAASRAEVADTLDLGNDDKVSYSDGAVLLYDMATADIIEITSFGDTYEYGKTEGRNVLSAYHDIYIAEGVVDATEFTGLYSKNAYCAEDTISVDGVTYVADGYHTLLGKGVRVFYRDDSKRTVVYAYANADNTKVFTADCDIALSGTKLSVTEPDESEADNYSLSSDYAVIYNGKAYAAADFSAVVNPDAGRVTIIDNNDDGKYDILSIESVEYGVIASVNIADQRIYDKYKAQGMIDMSASDFECYVYDTDGNLADIADLEEDTVVGYVMSDDKLLLNIHIHSKKVGGTISEISGDGTIGINGVFYKVSKYYNDNVKDKAKIKAGTEAILYLAGDNEVVYIKEYTSIMKYGYLVAQKPKSGLDSTVSLKIFSGDGMLSTSLADKLIFNGTPSASADLADDMAVIVAKDDAYRVIKFALNAKGEVTKLYTADDLGETSIFEERNSESRPLLFANYTGTYRAGIITPYAHLASNGTMLKIPKSDDYKLDDDKYEVYATSKLSTSTSSKYNIMAYDVDKGGAAGLMILLQDSGGEDIGSSTGSAVVEKVYQTLDEEGFEVTAVRIYTNGSWKDVYASETTVDAVKALAPGDIIRASIDSENRIVALSHDFVYATKTLNSGEVKLDPSKWDYNGAEFEYVAGPIFSYSGGYAYILTGSKEIPENVDMTKVFCTNLASYDTVYVRMMHDRKGNLEYAEVSTEANANNIESWFSAGADADFIVSRQRYRSPSLHIVYVD